MDPGAADKGLWTRERVEAAILEALRPKPGVTIIRGGAGYRALDHQHADLVEPLNWAARFVPDQRERRILQEWLRCKRETMAGAGFDASFNQVCIEREWKRSTAEDARRRATSRIVAGLNAEQSQLDNRKTRIRVSASPATEPSFIEA